MKKIIYNCLFILVLFTNCKNGDPYYTSYGGLDYDRIPLIKPYELHRNYKTWLVSGPNFYSSMCVKINVINKVIIGYWDKKVSINFKEVDSCWFFIVPEKKIEAEFSDKKIFLDSLSKFTKQKPVFSNVEEVWKQFNEDGYLEWFPEEYKK
ncbi:MAG: hypothetical protein HGB12_16165 [Bacteroidetes bacterium]|nr:hypothetical protein [Bacteroidota bacterium]